MKLHARAISERFICARLLQNSNRNAFTVEIQTQIAPLLKKASFNHIEIVCMRAYCL